MISPVSNAFYGGSSAPIRHDQAIVLPIVPQDIDQEFRLRVDMRAVDLGVTGHERPRVGLLGYNLEGLQINFPTRPR